METLRHVPPHLLTTAQAAAVLGGSAAHIRRLVQSGDLAAEAWYRPPFSRAKPTRLITAASVGAWCRAQGAGQSSGGRPSLRAAAAHGDASPATI